MVTNEPMSKVVEFDPTPDIAILQKKKTKEGPGVRKFLSSARLGVVMKE